MGNLRPVCASAHTYRSRVRTRTIVLTENNLFAKVSLALQSAKERVKLVYVLYNVLRIRRRVRERSLRTGCCGNSRCGLTALPSLVALPARSVPLLIFVLARKHETQSCTTNRWRRRKRRGREREKRRGRESSDKTMRNGVEMGSEDTTKQGRGEEE